MWEDCGVVMRRSCLVRPSASIWSSSACSWSLTPYIVISSAPVHDDLADLAGAGGLEGILPLLGGEAMGDDRADAVAQHLGGLQHRGHLVPGLVHLPAVDALEGDHV